MTIQEVFDHVTANGRSNVTFTALITRVDGIRAFMQDSTAGIYWTNRAGVSTLYPDIQVGNIVTIQADCEFYYGTLQIAYNYTPDSIVLESSGNEVTPVVITDGALDSCQLQSFTGTVTDVVPDNYYSRYPYFIVNNGIIDLVVHTDSNYSPEVAALIETLSVGQEVTVTGNSYYSNDMPSDYPNQMYLIDTDDVQVGPAIIYPTISEVKDYVLNNGGFGVPATLKGVVSRLMNFENQTYSYYIQDDTGAAKVTTQTPLSEFVSGNEVVFDGFFTMDSTGLYYGFWQGWQGVGEISNIQVLSTGNTITPITLEEAVNNPDINRFKLTSISGTLSGVDKFNGYHIGGNISYNELNLAIIFYNILNSTTYSEINDGSTFTAYGIQEGPRDEYEDLQFIVVDESDLISYTKPEPEFQMTIQEVLDHVTANGKSNVTFTALVTRVEGKLAFMQDSTAGLYWTVMTGVSDTYPDIQVGNIVTIQADCELFYGVLQIAYNYAPDSIVLESSGNEVTPVVITDAALGYCQLQSFTGTVTSVVPDSRYPYFIVNNGIIDLAVCTDTVYSSPELGSMMGAVKIGQEVTVVGNSFYRANGGLDSYPNQIYMIDPDDVPTIPYPTIAEVKEYVLNNGGSGVHTTLKGVVSRSIDWGFGTIFYYIQDDTGAARVITSTPLSEFVSGNEVVFEAFFQLDSMGLQCGDWTGEISNIQVIRTGKTITPITLEEAINNPDINRYKLTSISGTLSGVDKGYENRIQGNFSYNEQDLAITFYNILNSTTHSEINDGSTFTANGVIEDGDSKFMVVDESDLISYTKAEPEFQMKEFTGGMFLKQKDVNPKFSKVKFLNPSDYEALITDPSTAEANTFYYKSKVGSDIPIVTYSYNYDWFPSLDGYGSTVEPAKVTVFQDSSVDPFSSTELYQIFNGNFEYNLSDGNNLLSRISRLKYFHMVINAGVDAQFNGFTEKSIVVDLSFNFAHWYSDHYQGRIFFKVVNYYYYYYGTNNEEILPQVSYFVLIFNTHGGGIQSIGSSYERDTIGDDLSTLINRFEGVPVVLSRAEPEKYLISNVDIYDGGNGYQVGDTISFTLTDYIGTTFDFNWTVAEVSDEGWRQGVIKRLSGIDYDTIYDFDLDGYVHSHTTSGLGTNAWFRVKTKYAPGDYISFGHLDSTNEKDPLVQQSYVDLAIKNAITGFLEEGEIEV